MNWLRELTRRLRMLVRRRQFDTDLEEEMQLHLELRQQEVLKSGMTADDARAATRRRFGNVTALRERSRMAWGWEWLEDLVQDATYGVRAMLRSPGITLVALLSLALGIGANTAIFSFVNALILRTLPVRNPESLVLFGPGNSSGNSDSFPHDNLSLFSYPMYREIQKRNQVFSGVTAIESFLNEVHGTVEGSGALEPISVQLASGTYFDVLGVNPILGRTFTDADDQVLGGHPVAVTSYAWWAKRFGKDAEIIGKKLTIQGRVYTVIGVAPRGFLGTTVGDSADVWIPLQMEEQISRGPHKLNDKFYRAMDIIARRKPGVSFTQANSNVNVVLKQLLHEYAGTQPSRDRLRDIEKAHIELHAARNGKSELRLQFREPLWMLMAMVGLVLLIACANIANLLLARGTMRQREIAVRMALGAGRRRLIRQLLTEALMLAGLGGAIGIVFAYWASQALLTMVSGKEIIPLDVTLDAIVLGFTLVVSLLTVVLFGVLPALRTTRVELNPLLAGSRGVVTGSGRSRLGKALIVSQVSLSVVLLIGAGLFVRSLINLMSVDTGFDKQNVLLMQVDPHATGYSDEARLGALYRDVEERVSAIPGVKAASFSIWTFNQGGWNYPAWPEGTTVAPGTGLAAWYNPVGPGYFATMGLPVLEGRAFGLQDTAASPRVAVINQTMARRFFPGVSPIGKRFGMTSPEHSRDIEVVGVVRDAKYLDLSESPKSFAYYPYTQYSPSWGVGLYLSDFEVRFSGDPQTMMPAIRSTITEINPNLPIGNVQTLAERVDDSVIHQRLVAQLSGFFGLLAVLLACIGIYGLMSYTVSRRTNEIGIRMALGAGRVDVLRMVMRETVVLVVIGLAIGVPLALVSGRWLASLLFGLKPTDPVTLTAAVALLLGVAAFAGYLPARRASLVDPIVSLRYE